jgi:nucleoside-diphosphate-sugar epimerase
MKKVLITGGNGFIGKSLFDRLLVNDCDVYAGTRSTCVSERVLKIPELSSESDWKSLLRGVDLLVHAAGRAHIFNDKTRGQFEIFQRTNVFGTLKLAEDAAIAGVKRFIFISSIGVNGLQTSCGHPFTETDVPEPHNDYALSKWEAEVGLSLIADKTGMELVIIRPPLVYGANAPGNFGSLLRAVQRGWPLPLGATDNRRSLVALDNLVDFIVTCLHHPAAANQTFLVSDGQDLSTAELVQGMAQAAGVPARLLPVPVWALQMVAGVLGKGPAVQRLCGNLQVDISKARTVLGWEPPVSVAEGLRRVMGVDFGLPRSARNVL